MADKLIEVVLLCALPASGKSETRKYLEQLSGDECRKHFHFGKTVQLDDYPYVHMMRRVDEELAKIGAEYVFFESPDKCFREGRDWGTLIEILNEDYEDVVKVYRAAPESASAWLWKRYDDARERCGIAPIFKTMDAEVLKKLSAALEPEVATLLREKNEAIPDSLEGCTIVIEFARGGPEGSPLPIPDPFGYHYSLSHLSAPLLEKSAILYIWVTPEMSRAKNRARTDPNDPGSILNHGVPEHVMRNDYGADDLSFHIEHSDVPNTFKVVKHDTEKVYHVPTGLMDNREDLTTFARTPVPEWKDEDKKKLQQGIQRAFDAISKTYFDMH